MRIATRRRNTRAALRPGGPMFLLVAVATLILAVPVLLVRAIFGRAA